MNQSMQSMYKLSASRPSSEAEDNNTQDNNVIHQDDLKDKKSDMKQTEAESLHVQTGVSVEGQGTTETDVFTQENKTALDSQVQLVIVYRNTTVNH